MIGISDLAESRQDLIDFWSTDPASSRLVESWQHTDDFELPRPEQELAPATAVELLRKRIAMNLVDAPVYLANREFARVCAFTSAHTPDISLEASPPLQQPGLLLAEGDFADASDLASGHTLADMRGLMWMPCVHSSGDDGLLVFHLDRERNGADTSEAELSEPSHAPGVPRHSPRLFPIGTTVATLPGLIDAMAVTTLTLLGHPDIAHTVVPWPREARRTARRIGGRLPKIARVGLHSNQWGFPTTLP